MNKSESKYFNTSVKMNDALLEILKEKPFEYITISEICKRASVNRSTFYLHYENTADLMEETGRHLMEETGRHLMEDFLSYFTVDTKAITYRFTDCDTAELNFITAKYLHPYLSYIRKNQNAFSTVLKHANSFNFDGVFQRLFQHIFDPILDRFGYPAGDRTYVMMFYLNGLNAIILEWLKNNCNKSIEEISQVIYECIFGLNNGFQFHLDKQLP